MTTPPRNSPDWFQLIWHSGKWHLPLFGEKRWFRLVPCFPVQKSKQRVWAPASATGAAGEFGGWVGSRTKNRLTGLMDPLSSQPLAPLAPYVIREQNLRGTPRAQKSQRALALSLLVSSKHF